MEGTETRKEKIWTWCFFFSIEILEDNAILPRKKEEESIEEKGTKPEQKKEMYTEKLFQSKILFLCSLTAFCLPFTLSLHEREQQHNILKNPQ